MMETGFDLVLALLLVCVGAGSILARNMMTAVIIFIGYGLLLSLAWVRIFAVDVSLTEAAIGSGATGLLMVIAAHKVGADARRVVHPSRTVHVLAGVLAALVAEGDARYAARAALTARRSCAKLSSCVSAGDLSNHLGTISSALAPSTSRPCSSITIRRSAC